MKSITTTFSVIALAIGALFLALTPPAVSAGTTPVDPPIPYPECIQNCLKAYTAAITDANEAYDDAIADADQERDDFLDQVYDHLADVCGPQAPYPDTPDCNEAQEWAAFFVDQANTIHHIRTKAADDDLAAAVAAALTARDACFNACDLD